MRFYWPVTFAAAALVGLLAYGLASRGGGDAPAAAPATQLPRLGGGDPASLRDWRGKVVVVNFWASWCPPCRAEMPLLQRMHERIASRGGTVVGIDVEDGADAALRFARSRGVTFPSLRDVDGDYARGFGVTGYPETFVLDRSGDVAAERRGPVTGAWLRQNVDPLLEAS